MRSAESPTALHAYMEELSRYPLIGDADEERALARRAGTGDDQAAERLATANLRFVVSYVRRYQGRGLPIEDLVCLGNEGLLQALTRFDPERGVKFTSYAVWWIRQAVLRGIAEQAHPVRLPPQQASKLSKLARTSDRLRQSLERPPTDRQIATEMGESAETVDALRRTTVHMVSLDDAAPAVHWMAKAVDRYAEHRIDATAIERVDAVRCRRLLESILERHLSSREREIVSLYYGLDGNGPRTLQQIGTLHGVTRERIRQLRNRAIDKIRASPGASSLRSFVVSDDTR